jgi:hypothetical protein
VDFVINEQYGHPYRFGSINKFGFIEGVDEDG